MSENNASIYEITQLMKNPESLNKDFNAALNLVGQYFQGKYINPLRAAVEGHTKICSHNPSKEIVFLQACRPFVSQGGMNVFEQIMNVFNAYDVLQSISREYNANVVSAADLEDSAVHPDGVYEVDKNCVLNCAQTENMTDSDFVMIFFAVMFLLRGK